MREEPRRIKGRWVPIPPPGMEDTDLWVETCPLDRIALLPGDTEAECHDWEWVPYEAWAPHVDVRIGALFEGEESE
jgi:hypothetical protein